MCLKENQTPKRHINQIQCMDLIWILIHFLSLSLSLSLCHTDTHTFMKQLRIGTKKGYLMILRSCNFKYNNSTVVILNKAFMSFTSV